VLGVSGRRGVVRAQGVTVVMTLEVSVVDATAGGLEVTLDRSAVLVLPKGASLGMRPSAAASGSRVAVLGFDGSTFDEASLAYAKLGFDRARLEGWLQGPQLLPRTVWVHEIVHRYVFERYVLGEHDSVATRFLETEILKEIYFLFRDREAGADRASVVRKYGAPVERAIAHIESHLFAPCSVPELASHCGASESTLLRAFRKELGCTPSAYWRTRKLDEALVLLREGRHSVAEIASEVGYDNPTAFGHAFRLRFGQPPSTFRPQRPVRRAP
jgi:AraC-like DNA-binding protein